MYASAICAAVTGTQYLEGLDRFKAINSLNNGGVVAFIMPSFLLSYGDWSRGRDCNTGGLFPMDSYKLIPIQSQ